MIRWQLDKNERNLSKDYGAYGMMTKTFCFLAAIGLGGSSFAGDGFIPIKVVAGTLTSCALSSQGDIKCWGLNDQGQLGIGSTKTHGYEPDTMGDQLPIVNLGAGVKAIELCTSGGHSCAITQDRQVKCWGDNSSGQLGPSLKKTVGTVPEDMGDNLPYLDLGSKFAAKSISCDSGNTCILSVDGIAKCLGNNWTGQLGIESNKKTVGLNPQEMGSNLKPVIERQKIIELKSTCALRTDRSLRCWSNNEYGQAGIESDELHGGDPGSMGDELPTVMLEPPGVKYAVDTWAVGHLNVCAVYHLLDNTRSSKLKCWGHAYDHDLVLVQTDKPGSMSELPTTDLGFPSSEITQLSVGEAFACALNRQGRVKCWGLDRFGTLGLGDDNYHGLGDPASMGKNLPFVDLGLPVLSLSEGQRGFRYHMCAILINHTVKCWGYNEFGVLGNERTDNYGTKADQMGENLPIVRLN